MDVSASIEKEAWYIEAASLSTVSPKDLERLLTILGWKKSRHSGGSHAQWKHPQIRWVITNVVSSKNISANVLRSVMQRAGIDKRDLRFLLDKRAMRKDRSRLRRIIQRAPVRAQEAHFPGMRS